MGNTGAADEENRLLEVAELVEKTEATGPSEGAAAGAAGNENFGADECNKPLLKLGEEKGEGAADEAAVSGTFNDSLAFRFTSPFSVFKLSNIEVSVTLLNNNKKIT